MLSRSDQAAANVASARALRAAGRSYRDIRQELNLSAAQLGHVRRVLKREKGGRTRLFSTRATATDRDLLIARSVLPKGLRTHLAEAGHVTLGDLADRMADPALPGLETLPGIGPHRARQVRDLIEQFDLFEGSADLRADVESIFPELGE